MNKNIVVISIVTLVIGLGAGYFIANSSSSSSENNENTSQANSMNNSESSSSSSNSSKKAGYSNQGLSEFPKEALENTSTTDLDLSGNDLTGSLPSEIANLTKLESLNVSDNNMTGIPAEIGRLSNLKILNYANNSITGLPLELGDLQNLETLDLRGNDVSEQDLGSIREKLPKSVSILTD